MRFLIISHALHYREEPIDLVYAYAPYVREMNMWSKHVDELEIVAPGKNSIDRIDTAYEMDSVSAH